MPIAIDINDSPIVRGIKTVGIGKKGSQELERSLVEEIFRDLRENLVDPVQKGAFFAALIQKGVTAEESILKNAFAPGVFDDPHLLAKTLSPDAPPFIQWICGQILSGHTLDVATAQQVGEFLFSQEPGDGARGLIASYLRVRYETNEEYEGLLKAIEDTLEPSFKEPVPAGRPIIQLAEPFDGVTRSYFITPLIAEFIQRHNYRVISLVGRSSGPKMGNTLLDIAKAINGQFAQRNQDLEKLTPDFGWFIDQKDLSKPLDRWVDIRRKTIKRPFLATLERFVNPCKARIVIASAFHPPYTEKMVTVCEGAGFPGAIVMRNGQEGTLSFPLNRSVKVLCSARQKDGSYIRQEFEFSPAHILEHEIGQDEKLAVPTLKDNAQLIFKYKGQRKSGNIMFDDRVKVTTLALGEALAWVERNIIN